MSDTYTWPQRCPDLVQDVSLKRARIDNENNTSTIRTTIAGVDADHPLPVLEKAIRHSGLFLVDKIQNHDFFESSGIIYLLRFCLILSLQSLIYGLQ